MSDLDAFDSYIGKKVNVREEEVELNLPNLGIKQKLTQCHLDESDPVVQELNLKHSNIRWWVPGVMGTCDWQPSRLNVHVDKNDAGDYVVTCIKYG